jgi:acyl-CoA synthetase (AMP-forming)/AMP-acid ligase II
MNIAVLLEIAAGMAPDHAAVTDRHGSLTLGELHGLASAFAGRVLQTGLEGPVAFIDVNGRAFPIALFGAALAGRPFVPLNFRGDQRLIRHSMEAVEPSIVVAGPRYVRLVESIETWETESLLRLSQTASVQPLDSPEGVAVQIFTSGTTSAPKAASLLHANLTSYVLGSVEPLGDADACALITAPNYHIATVANTLTSIYAGRRIVFLEQFDAHEWLEVAQREKVTNAFVVPTMLERICQAIAEGASPPEHLRTLAYGGAAASRATVEAALACFGDRTGLVNAYGLTETSSTISLLGADDHREAHTSDDPLIRARLMSAGRVLPGVEMTISEAGEILVRGHQVGGTYGNGLESERLRDGWFHTGDLGRIDDGGYLFIEGRVDDMIIRGGENISPLEVENALSEHPAVAGAAVVGVADPEWGQRVVAAVELQGEAEPAELLEWLRSRLPSFKRPEEIVVVAELPRTDLGKLQRRKVKAQFEQRAEIVEGV